MRAENDVKSARNGLRPVSGLLSPKTCSSNRELHGSLCKFLLCKSAALSPFQAVVVSSCRHLETPSAKNQYTRQQSHKGTGGEPSPSSAPCAEAYQKARLLGKPSLNRGQEFANILCSFRHKFCPFRVQTHSQQHFARSQHCCSAGRDFLSVQSHKQNTQHWQQLVYFYQETTTFLQTVSQPLCCLTSQWPEAREGRLAGPCQAVLFSSACMQCLSIAATRTTQS